MIMLFPSLPPEWTPAALTEGTHIPAVISHEPDPYSLPYELPVLGEERSVEDDQMVSQIKNWTGWSNRALAEVIGTTHPTIRAVQEGRLVLTPRNPEYRRRLRETYEVMARLAVIAGNDTARLRDGLDTVVDGRSASDHLRNDRPSEAYLLAIRQLRPPSSDQLRVGSRPMPVTGRIIDPFGER